MKSKIFTKLKQAYSPLGLGDEILMSRAESLAALGLVTDENIDAVVAAQKSDMEALQKRFDKRVNDAIDAANKRHLDENQKKEAETKTKIDELLKQIETLKHQDEPQQHGDNHDDTRIASIEKQVAEMLAASKQREEENAKLIKTLTDSNSALEKQVKSLTDENSAAKAAQARAAHIAKINDKAKELGVPDWRIDEGFNIAEDASDETIAEVLGKVANNISTNLLPSNHGLSLSNGQPTADEISALAASIVK
ncbi:MAG: hypothetical protein ACI4SO_02435 [Muribaculaceae bacterium]